jgi:ectoine hydroxylase-related dioxygenase (phytanoyl-CoA dioxygenase family)
MKNILKIKKNGFVLIKNLIPKKKINEMLKFVKEYGYSKNELEIIKNKGMRLNNYADNIFDLVSKKPQFLELFTHSTIGKYLKYFLNDKYYKSIDAKYPNYIIRSMLARSSKDSMPWHIDNFIPYCGKLVSVMQVSIYLEESTLKSGCTRVVPRSHLSGKYSPQTRFGTKPVLLEASPGDVAIWDSRLWHSTTKNRSNNSRWAIIGTFCRWYIKQGFDYPKSLAEKYKSLSIESKIVLGYPSKVPLNEFEKTEVKGSLEELKKN